MEKVVCKKDFVVSWIKCNNVLKKNAQIYFFIRNFFIRFIVKLGQILTLH